MPTELIMTIITEIVAMIGILLTFTVSMKKLKMEQAQRMDEHNNGITNQISSFQKDTREEMSLLQDSFAAHEVKMHDSIRELQFSQEKFQESIEQRMSELEQSQDTLASMVNAFHDLDKRLSIMEGERRSV